MSSGITHKIFALRRAKRSEEAYAECKHSFPDFSALTDRWEVAAVGWTLIDQINLVRKYGIEGPEEGFLDELAQLQIGDDDEILAARVSKLLKKSGRTMRRRAAGAGAPVQKSGRTSESRGQPSQNDDAFEAKWRAPMTPERAEDLALGCEERVRRAIFAGKASDPKTAELFERFLTIPSEMVSEKTLGRMQLAACRYYDAPRDGLYFSLVDFLIKTGGMVRTVDRTVVSEWLDVERYLLVDASLLIGAIRELDERLSEGEILSDEVRRFIKDDLMPAQNGVRNVAEAPTRVDLTAASVALRAGIFDAAFETGADVAVAGRYAFEAALIAAESRLAESPEDAAAIYAAALTVFAPAPHMERAAEPLVKTLISLGRTSEARTAAEYMPALFKLFGKRLPKAVKELAALDVLQTAEKSQEKPMNLLDRLGRRGEDLLHYEAEELRGVVGRTITVQTTPAGKPEEKVILAVDEGNHLPTVMMVPAEALRGFSAPEGTNVLIKGWEDEEGEYRVVGIRKDELGHDVPRMEKRTGKVTGFDAVNGVAHVRLSKKRTVSVPFGLLKARGIEAHAGDELRVTVGIVRGTDSGRRAIFDVALPEPMHKQEEKSEEAEQPVSET